MHMVPSRLVIALLLLICVSTADHLSNYSDSELAWVDEDYGEEHQVSIEYPVNISDASSGFRFEFVLHAMDSFLNMTDAQSFAVLAANSVRSEGATTCNGDFGIAHGDATLINGTKFDENITCTGRLEVNNSVAQTALMAANYIVDVGVSYPCDVYYNEDLESNLAGKTLAPGVYCFNGTDAWVVGADLRLDGGGDFNASWIFKIDGRLTIGSRRAHHVHVFNGGSPCNVYWLVGGVVKVRKESKLVGTVISYSNIHLRKKAIVEGRVISLHGNVGLNLAVIDNSFCSLATHEEEDENNVNVTHEIRAEQNRTIAIYRADLIPLPLEGENDSYHARIFTFTNYQGAEHNWTDPNGDNNYWWIYGFEIVSDQTVGPLSINITSMVLNAAQREDIEYSSAVELWWVSPYPNNTVYRDTCELCEYDARRLCHVSTHGSGLYYFAVVNYTNTEGSSSSTGGPKSSSTGDIIATASETGGGGCGVTGGQTGHDGRN